MGDQNSESSGDSWVFVNESDNISLEEDKNQPLNSELSQDSVSLAALDSIQSSLSSEELEWQFDDLENFTDILPHYSLHIEDLHLDNNQNGCVKNHNQDQTRDIDCNSCSSSTYYEEFSDIDVASIHKIQSYKHNRNDRLNFILNIMLALTVSLALGLGTGHFLGWSHKCWRDMPYFKENSDHILPDTSVVNQHTPDFLTAEKEIKSSISFSLDLAEELDLPTKMKSDSKDIATCKKILNKVVVNDISDTIFQNSVSGNSEILELSVNNVVKQGNVSDLENSTTSKTIYKWSLVSQIVHPVKNLNEHLFHTNDETASEKDKDLLSGEIYMQSNFFNGYDNKNKDSDKGTNFTSELRKNLMQVVQTLNAIALTHISRSEEVPFEVLESMTKLYKNLEIIITSKISYIDEFIQSRDYKKYPTLSLKHTQKMIYSLIDTFDYVMKTNMKTFGKIHKPVNSYKFYKNISKIISNFEKRWERNSKSWFVSIEKTKAKVRDHYNFNDFNKNNYKREKKHWKNKASFDNDSNKIHKYKSHSVKY